MEKVQITFIHELGHHIANELNKRLFDFDRTTKSILLYPSEKGDFFDGRTISSNSTEDFYQPENSPLEYIRSFYGCLFESLFRKINIEKCLCSQATPLDIAANLCKGRADYYQMFGVSVRPEIKNRFGWWRFLTVDYFNLMKPKTNMFKNIFELRYMDYVQKKDGSVYEVDLDRVNENIESFLLEHQDDFKMAVKELQRLNTE